MELLLMIDAAKEPLQKALWPLFPTLDGRVRTEKDKPRVSIGARLVADLLERSRHRPFNHNGFACSQIQGFFDVPVDYLYASGVFLPYIESLQLEDLVIATPDVGVVQNAPALIPNIWVYPWYSATRRA